MQASQGLIICPDRKCCERCRRRAPRHAVTSSKSPSATAAAAGRLSRAPTSKVRGPPTSSDVTHRRRLTSLSDAAHRRRRLAPSGCANETRSAKDAEVAEQVPEHDEDDDGAQTAATQLLRTPTRREATQYLAHARTLPRRLKRAQEIVGVASLRGRAKPPPCTSPAWSAHGETLDRSEQLHDATTGAAARSLAGPLLRARAPAPPAPAPAIRSPLHGRIARAPRPQMRQRRRHGRNQELKLPRAEVWCRA